MNKFLGKHSLIIAIFVGFNIPSTFAETITVFCNLAIPRYEFAANDIKTSLESRSYMVEFKNLSRLTERFMGTNCYWEGCTRLMDALYYSVDTHQNWNFKDSDLHNLVDEALHDYLDLGGVGKPNCDALMEVSQE